MPLWKTTSGSLRSFCGCQPAARRLLNEKKMEACLGSVEFVLTFDASVHMVKSYRPIPDMSRQLPQRLIFLCKSPYNLHCLLTSNLGRNINPCYKLILILHHWWRELGLWTRSEQQEENISACDYESVSQGEMVSGKFYCNKLSKNVHRKVHWYAAYVAKGQDFTRGFQYWPLIFKQELMKW